ncbi:MAG: GIY-YIG nuclease family protein [Promethearchaeota archaeon]
MPVYYVYILEATTNNGNRTFYTGYTSDLHRRIHEHGQAKGAKYCRGKGLRLKYFESFLERTQAMRREKEIKSYSRQKKMDLIKTFQKN